MDLSKVEQTEASAVNGYVGAIVMKDGLFKVRLFFVEGHSVDLDGPPMTSALDAAKALFDVLSSVEQAGERVVAN